MFNDFDDDAQQEEGTGRRAASMAISAALFLLIGSGLAATMATVRAMQPRRPDQDVEFASLEELQAPEPAPEPEPEPPPPPPPARRARPDRPAGERPRLDGPPEGIPEEQPEEADGDLAETTNTGPIDNDAQMGEGGGEESDSEEPPAPTPPPERPAEAAPEQERLTIQRARFDANRSRCRSLVIPDDVAESLGARTVRIRVRALVGSDGSVMNASVVSGDPVVPEALVLRCAEQWVFAPATLPDGTAVPYPAIRTFVITPRT